MNFRYDVLGIGIYFKEKLSEAETKYNFNTRFFAI